MVGGGAPAGQRRRNAPCYCHRSGRSDKLGGTLACTQKRDTSAGQPRRRWPSAGMSEIAAEVAIRLSALYR